MKTVGWEIARGGFPGKKKKQPHELIARNRESEENSSPTKLVPLSWLAWPPFQRPFKERLIVKERCFRFASPPEGKTALFLGRQWRVCYSPQLVWEMDVIEFEVTLLEVCCSEGLKLVLKKEFNILEIERNISNMIFFQNQDNVYTKQLSWCLVLTRLNQCMNQNSTCVPPPTNSTPNSILSPTILSLAAWRDEMFHMTLGGINRLPFY